MLKHRFITAGVGSIVAGLALAGAVLGAAPARANTKSVLVTQQSELTFALNTAAPGDVVNAELNNDITWTAPTYVPPGVTLNLTSNLASCPSGCVIYRGAGMAANDAAHPGAMNAATELFDVLGSANLTHIVLDGAGLPATAGLIWAAGDVTIGDGAVLRNANNIYPYPDVATAGGPGGTVTYNAGSRPGLILIAGGAISQYCADVVNGSFNTFEENGPCTVTILPGAQISGNIAKYGGGVFSISGEVVMTGGQIAGNQAIDGGGVYKKDAVSESSFTMTGGAITGNQASRDGGGIYLEARYVSASLSGTARIENNSAGASVAVFQSTYGSGGGIYLGKYYQKLTVGAGVTFAGNSAAAGYLLADPALIATHQADIATTAFSAPYGPGPTVPFNGRFVSANWAFNNLDVNYYLQTYTVTYDSQGGSAVVASNPPFVNNEELVAASTAALAPPVPPTKSGSHFAGWCTDLPSESELCTLYDFAMPVSANLTLYAQWQPAGSDPPPAGPPSHRSETGGSMAGSGSGGWLAAACLLAGVAVLGLGRRSARDTSSVC